jgi:hypothetical protein
MNKYQNRPVGSFRNKKIEPMLRSVRGTPSHIRLILQNLLCRQLGALIKHGNSGPPDDSASLGKVKESTKENDFQNPPESDFPHLFHII